MMLEADVNTASPERVNLLFSIFSQLVPYKQCVAIVAAGKVAENLSVSLLAKETYKGLYRIFPLICNFYSPFHCESNDPVQVIDQMVEIYLKLGDEQLLHLLLDKIVRCGIDQPKQKTKLIEKVLNSKDVFDCLASADFGRPMLNQLIKAQLVSLQAAATGDGGEWNPCEQSLMLSSCVLRVMQMEFNPQLADTERVESLTELFRVLSPQCLCQLISDLRSSAPSTLLHCFTLPSLIDLPTGQVINHPSNLKIIKSLGENLYKKLYSANEVVRQLILHQRKILFSTLPMFCRMESLGTVANFMKTIFRAFLKGRERLENTEFNINCILLLKDILTVDGIWSALAGSDTQSLILDVCYSVLMRCIDELTVLHPELEILDSEGNGINVVCPCIELVTILEKKSSEYGYWPKKQVDVQRNLYQKLYRVCCTDQEALIKLDSCYSFTVVSVFHFALQFDGEEEEEQLPLLQAFTKKIIDAFPPSEHNPLVFDLFNSDDRLWLRLDEFRQTPNLLTASKINALLALIDCRIASKPNEMVRLEEFRRFLLKVPRLIAQQQMSPPPVAKKARFDHHQDSPSRN